MAIAPRDYKLRPRRVRILLISSVDLLLRVTLACKYQLVWLDAFIMAFHYITQVFIIYSKCMATDTVIEYTISSHQLSLGYYPCKAKNTRVHSSEGRGCPDELTVTITRLYFVKCLNCK